MHKLDPNAPAFPQARLAEDEEGNVYLVTEGGLTVHQEFAKAAMQGLLAGMPPVDQDVNTPDEVASVAVICADALIAALNEEKP